MMTIKELLRNKRLGHEWSEDSIRSFVDGLTTKKVSSAQAGAFLMAACIHGLTPRETATLTQAMASSGITVPTNGLERPCIDKHSTGGVGDKVSLLLAPLAVACGLAVPMISGRGLGHTGGTIDKLESIPGFNTSLSVQRMRELLEQHHVFMAAQTDECAPADGILYALRDVTGTVEDVGLITASILSKKISEGISGLVMDIKSGEGAFFPNLDDGRTLGTSIRTVAGHAGIQSAIVYSDMSIPLGRAVGNWLEVVESEQALREFASCDHRLRAVTIHCVAEMVLMGGLTNSIEEARTRVVDKWLDGSGYREFLGMIERQGGVLVDGHVRQESACSQSITSPVSMVMPCLPAREVAIAVMEAGGGRLVDGDVIDNTAGCVIVADPGMPVESGQVLMHVTAAITERCSALVEALESIIERAKARGIHEPPDVIIDVDR